MKIKNKKGFWGGVGSSILGIAAIVSAFIGHFDLKLLILGAVVLFSGLGVICNNIHLEDDDDNEQ